MQAIGLGVTSVVNHNYWEELIMEFKDQHIAFEISCHPELRMTSDSRLLEQLLINHVKTAGEADI